MAGRARVAVVGEAIALLGVVAAGKEAKEAGLAVAPGRAGDANAALTGVAGPSEVVEAALRRAAAGVVGPGGAGVAGRAMVVVAAGGPRGRGRAALAGA